MNDIELQQIKSELLQNAYKLKDYQSRINKLNNRLIFVDDLILKSIAFMDKYSAYLRPLVDSVYFFSKVQESLQKELEPLIRERDELLYRNNQLMQKHDEITGKKQFKQFICRRYLSDIWNSDTKNYINFEAQMSGESIEAQ